MPDRFAISKKAGTSENNFNEDPEIGESGDTGGFDEKQQLVESTEIYTPEIADENKEGKESVVEGSAMGSKLEDRVRRKKSASDTYSEVRSTASRTSRKGKKKHKEKKRKKKKPEEIKEKEVDPEKGIASQTFKCPTPGPEQFLTFFLASFMLFGNSTTFLTFNGTNESCIADFYRFKGSQVAAYLTTVHALMYVPGTVIGLYIASFNTMNACKNCLQVGGYLTLVGIVFRITSLSSSLDQDFQYLALLVGQVLCGLAQPLILNIIVRVVDSWFPVQERDWVTIEVYMAQPVGMVMGLLLSFKLPSAFGCGSRMWMILFLIQGVMVLLGTSLVQLFFQDMPRDSNGRLMPASLSNQVLTHNQATYCQGKKVGTFVMKAIWFLFKSKNFLFLMVAFAMLLAQVNGIIVSPATSNFNMINPVATGRHRNVLHVAYAVMFVVGGICGASVYGAVLSSFKHPRHHFFRHITFFVIVGATVLCNWFLDDKCFGCGCLCHFTLGLFSLPLVPLCLECAAELTYDLSQDFSTGLLFSLGSLFFIFFNYTSTASENIANPDTEVSKWYGIIYGLLAATFSILSKGIYRRYQYDQKSHKSVFPFK